MAANTTLSLTAQSGTKEVAIMVSNMSSLGFAVSNEHELQALVVKLAGEASAGLTTSVGDYRIWRSRTGAELWFHVANTSAPSTAASASGQSQPEEREIVGLTPFFEGKSSVLANITTRFQRDGDTPFEGALQAWVLPAANPSKYTEGGRSTGTADDDDDDGVYPIVFDCVEYAAHAASTAPSKCNIRLAGFAREVSAYPNEAAFDEAQSASPHPLAAQSFFPVGMFAAASGDSQSPSSHAMFAGEVLETAQFINEETKNPYQWMLVKSLEATFDVVADPSCITGTVEPGAIVQVACWMFGRILPETT
ncbi:MAG: hypothetical protein AAFV45_11260 [Pseudomonadota bacterium]